MHCPDKEGLLGIESYDLIHLKKETRWRRELKVK